MNTTSTYIKGWFLWFFCAVAVFTAQAQKDFLASDFSRRNMLDANPTYNQEETSPNTPKTPAKPLATVAAYTTSPYLFEDHFIGHQPSRVTTSYNNQPIEWQFHANNLFNIENQDNPFSLPQQPQDLSFNSPRSSKMEQITQIWKEVTTLDNPNSKHSNPVWLSFLYFGLLGYVAVQFSLYRDEMRRNLQAFLSASTSSSTVRDDKGFFEPASLNANLTYGFSMGTFWFLASQQLGNAAQFNTFSAWLLCVLGAAALYVSKYGQVWFFSQWLPCPAAFNFYNFTISNSNKLIGLGLIPFVLMMSYTQADWVLYLAAAALSAVYVYRALRAAANSLDLIVENKLHFAIYSLCVEIAPILIAMKVLGAF